MRFSALPGLIAGSAPPAVASPPPAVDGPRLRPVPDRSVIARQMAGEYPNIAALLEGVSHDPDTTLGWCDDQFEFEFALDLLLDGLERLRDAEPS